MIIIWGIYTTLMISCAVIYFNFEKNQEIKEILNLKSKSVSQLQLSIKSTSGMKDKEINFWSHWKMVKFESLQIILAYFLQYLVFPGIFYSLEVSLHPKFIFILTILASGKISGETLVHYDQFGIWTFRPSRKGHRYETVQKLLRGLLQRYPRDSL